MSESKAVVVSTEKRGVFFGYLDDYEENRFAENLTLKDCRMCVRWSSSIGGFNGLASKGPDNQCRVSPKVSEHNLQKITSIMLCSEDAVKAWEKEPWC